MLKATMIIRAIDAADIAEVASLHLASWRAAYEGIVPAEVLAGLSEEGFSATWREELANNTRGHLLCQNGAKINGFVSFGPCEDEDAAGKRIGEIYSMYLHPRAWGRGTGRALCDAALARLAAQGHREVTLWVLFANSRARRFYEAAGFSLEEGVSKVVRRNGAELLHARYRRPAT